MFDVAKLTPKYDGKSYKADSLNGEIYNPMRKSSQSSGTFANEPIKFQKNALLDNDDFD